jgi:hypothetical protein
MSDREIWKEIDGTEGYYQISSLGRARSVDRSFVDARGRKRRFAGALLVITDDGNGYQKFGTNIRGVKGNKSVHVEVLRAFVGEKPAGTECCHKNGNRKDNRLKNLRWGTHASNTLDKKAHGTILQGEENPCSKLTEEQVLSILRSDESHAELAKRYSVSDVLIGKIRNGESWVHVPRTPEMFVKKVKLWVVHGRAYRTLAEAAAAEGEKEHVIRYRCAGRRTASAFYPPAEGHRCVVVEVAAEQGVKFTTADHWGIGEAPA